VLGPVGYGGVGQQTIALAPGTVYRGQGMPERRGNFSQEISDRSDNLSFQRGRDALDRGM